MKRGLSRAVLSGCCAILMSGLWPITATAEQHRWPILNTAAAAFSPSIRPFLVTAAVAGNRLVVGGERGFILLSDDQGMSWRQAAVPVGVTITAIRFATAQRGWAVGHFGVVLSTEDGGATWTKRLDGIGSARLIYDAALRRTGGDHASEAVRLAERLVRDGPDKPLLDMLILGEKSVLVVGSYGSAFRSDDGGGTWAPEIGAFDNPQRLHISAISSLQPGGVVFAVGEQGTLLKSADGGKSFTSINSPYEGSFMGVLATSDKDALILGLRGNAFQTADGGASWKALELKGAATLTASLILQDGSLLLADQGGQLFVKPTGVAEFSAVEPLARVPLAGLAQAGNGMVYGVGPAGVAPVLSPLARQ